MPRFTIPTKMLGFLSYRHLVYFATVLTGFAALCAQVVWQRYLAILVGSESRSITLVVAVFLLGLASGYYAFGRLTERKWSRFALLKVYGYTELLTGLYIFFFYLYFELLKILSFQGPSYLPFDILIACLALFLPTFLMGASIPLLTAALPEDSRELSYIHSRIYGWNTLGAFFGALVSGFYLLPVFGLRLSLMIVGIVNVLAALVYIGNRLNGAVHRQDAPPVLPSAAPNWVYLLFSFFAGGVIVSFEVLLVRVLNLSVGPGIYNFPMVLSVFVGALAVGSLSLKGREFSVAFLMRQVFITLVLLGLLYASIPYWPIWLNNMRVSLTTLPSNYYIYKFLVYVFLLLLLSPAVFFMGRLLPLVYALLRKNQDNYGAVCGRLYFFNTLGTVMGTVLIGYLAFYWLNLDQSFRINLLILLVAGTAIALFERSRPAIVLFAVIGTVLVTLPGWDRGNHYVGYFRDRTPVAAHFEKLFYLPKEQRSVRFFDDGPNTTVSVLDHEMEDESDSERIRKLLPEFTYNYSLVVNGKSDGNLLYDFSTTLLLASLPYLHMPPGKELSASVIGLGTGISAGVLGRLDDVGQVVVLEISPKVVEGIAEVQSANFAPLSNPRVELVEGDAFRYFTKSKKKFDIIVSEPSNPWVTGVENLYSSEFYRLVSQSLSRQGILSQWMHFYEIDADTVRMIVNTIRQEFRYVEIYRIGSGDLVFLAGNQPLEIQPQRFSSPFLQPIHRSMGFRNAQELKLVQVYEQERLSRGNSIGDYREHTLMSPKLTYMADRDFFMHQRIDPWEIYPGYLMASPVEERRRIGILAEYLESLESDPNPDPWMDSDSAAQQVMRASKRETGGIRNAGEMWEMVGKVRERCMPASGFSFFCDQMADIITDRFIYADPDQDIDRRFLAYQTLRKFGFLAHQNDFMDELKTGILAKELGGAFAITAYTENMLSQKQYAEAYRDLELFRQKELLIDEEYNRIRSRIAGVEELNRKWAEGIGIDAS